MPIKTLSGMPGLLATATLGETVLKELPDLTGAINKYQSNLPLMNALYRDYSFLASSYLLEPCHERFMKGESYGLGRMYTSCPLVRTSYESRDIHIILCPLLTSHLGQTLPSVIALPIARCAEL
jgi:indoleamine 2,3-dioxygenase